MKKEMKNGNIVSKLYDEEKSKEITKKLAEQGFEEALIETHEEVKRCFENIANINLAGKTAGKIFERMNTALKKISGSRQKAEAVALMGELSRKVFINYIIRGGHDAGYLMNKIREEVKKICAGNFGEFEKFIIYFNPEFPDAINLMEGFNANDIMQCNQASGFFEKLLKLANTDKTSKKAVRRIFNEKGMIPEIFSFYNNMCTTIPDKRKKSFKEAAIGCFLSGFIALSDSKLNETPLENKNIFLLGVKVIFPQLCLALLRKSGGREKEFLMVIKQKIEDYCNIFSEINVNTVAFYCRLFHTLPEFAEFFSDEDCSSGYKCNLAKNDSDDEIYLIIMPLAKYLADHKIISFPSYLYKIFVDHKVSLKIFLNIKHAGLFAVIWSMLYEKGIIDIFDDNGYWCEIQRHLQITGSDEKIILSKIFSALNKKGRKKNALLLKEYQEKANAIFQHVWGDKYNEFCPKVKPALSKSKI